MTGLIIIIILGALVYGAHKNGFATSEGNKVLGGVCAGIGAKLNLAPNLVRVLTVLAGLISGGFVLVLYVLLWISLPKR
jgi:phage shock protein C